MNKIIKKIKISSDIYIKHQLYKKILLMVLNILLNITIISGALYIKDRQFENWLFPFACMSLSQLFVNIVTIVKLEKAFFSLTNLFLIFSFIVHLGILIIFGFEIDVVLPWNPLYSITEEAFKEACYFTVYSYVFLVMGMSFMLIIRKNYTKYYQESNIIKLENKELYLARRIGWVLIFLGIIPMLYIDISRIILYMNGDYLSTYNVNVSGISVIVARMTEIGAMLLLIGNYKNKKRAQLILLIILFYQCLILYTGNRGRPVMYLIVILFIYHRFINEISFKKFIRFSIGVYFFSFLLVFIGKIRMLSINNSNVFLELLKESFSEFTVFQIVAEFGVSIITLGHSLNLFPSTRSFQFGTNYLASLLTVFPNFGGMLSVLTNKIVYVYNWPLDIRTYLGGSYLGEMYYSFGQFGLAFSMVIGIMVAFVSNKINECIEKKLYVKLSIYLMIFINFLWWVRNYFGDMVRECIWVSFVIIILYMNFNNKILNKHK